MSVVRHVARAVATTSTAAPTYRTEVRAGVHELVADEPTAAGGADAGPSPFGLLVSGLASCTAITLRMYADRKGWIVPSIEVDTRYDVDDGGAATIVRTITVPKELPADQRERLAEIAERTPVTKAVRAGTPITTTVVSAPTG